MAEGVGFEPTVAFRLRLISSQVPSTTQPPFQPFIYSNLFCSVASGTHFARIRVRGKLIHRSLESAVPSVPTLKLILMKMRRSVGVRESSLCSSRTERVMLMAAIK